MFSSKFPHSKSLVWEEGYTEAISVSLDPLTTVIPSLKDQSDFCSLAPPAGSLSLTWMGLIVNFVF